MTGPVVDWVLLDDIQLTTDGAALHYDAPLDAAPGCAERLRRHKSELIEWLTTPDSDGVCSRHPLSYYQVRQWTRHTQHPDPSIYNVRWEVELDGPVRPAALADALTALVARHEALRTRFVRRGGQVVAEVMSPTAVALPVMEKSDPRPSTVDSAFDLTVAPLLRAALVRRGADAWTLLLVLHHLACDHTTLAILLDDLSALYRGDPLGDPVPYAGFARWERRTLDDPGERERLLRYWRANLAGAELRPPLPTDRPRPAVRSGRGAEHRFTVDGDVVRNVDAVARRCGGTRYTVLCAAFALLLGRLTGRTDVVVISSSTSRTRREDERAVGVFTDALALRVRLDRAATLADLVGEVGRTVFAALDNRPMPLAVLVADLEAAPAADPDAVPAPEGTPPVPTVLFTVLGGDPPVPHLPGVTATVVPGPPATVARMELYLTVQPYQGGLLGSVEYATDLFDAATVERWSARFARLLAAIDPSATDRPVADLPG